jgi:sphinganine C4-monooxygenase
MNSSSCPTFFDGHSICYPPAQVPFYHTDRRALVPGIPDSILALIAPIVAYWSLSLLFHAFDISGWRWLEKYRIHESAEVKNRNLASRSDVVGAVLLQQTLQTMLGLVWVTEDVSGSWKSEMEDVGTVMVRVIRSALGMELGGQVLRAKGPDMAYFLYWWGIPAAQFCFAMYVFISLHLWFR